MVDFPTGAGAGEVDADTVFALGVAVGPGMFLLWVTVLIILSRYRLSRADHADILRQLEARRIDAERPGREDAAP